MAMSVESRPSTVTTSASTQVEDDDPIVREWLAYVEAASQPRDELLKQSIRTVLKLQNDNFLTEAEATDLIRRVAALQVESYLSDAIAHWLAPSPILGHTHRRGNWLSAVSHLHHQQHKSSSRR
jgi:hypothetical protein